MAIILFRSQCINIDEFPYQQHSNTNSTLYRQINFACPVGKKLHNSKSYIDGLAHDCSNSTANALDSLQYCSKPSIRCHLKIISKYRKMCSGCLTTDRGKWSQFQATRTNVQAAEPTELSLGCSPTCGIQITHGRHLTATLYGNDVIWIW